MDSEDDLDILTALLSESEAVSVEERGADEGPDDFDQPPPSPPPPPPPPPQPASKTTPASKKTKTQTSPSSSAPHRDVSSKLQESLDFSEQLNTADSSRSKHRVAHQAKQRTSQDDRGPLVEIKLGSSFQPVKKSTEGSGGGRSASASFSRAASAAVPPPDHPKDLAVERYSRLRLRKPRVSSTEMDLKMAGRRLVALSQLPERLTRDKLEDSDWVTFAVLVNKSTPQSSSSGRTFSIWKLNDLHNLEVFVSLLLFGEVHKELWKTELGTVLGVLNPNPMKQKEGYEGVSLTVDHPQKVLIMGEAQDFGTCKAMKKNGDPCCQIVNMYECQFCQYHVKAQYKKMSSKRAELQSSFSGKAPNKGGLKERLCRDGFYYGGVSSAACAASLTASQSKKPRQKTLDKLFVKGSSQLLEQAKPRIWSGQVSGCSDEFRSLMSAPTPGALQLKKHLVRGGQPVSKGSAAAPVQSITATELLKQQKQKQQELLQSRRHRLTSSPGSPPQHPPTLGRGFSQGQDIVFFDRGSCPPPAPAPPGLSAAKMAALRRLRDKGRTLEKEDPNCVKRKRSDDSEIQGRVERSLRAPGQEEEEEEEEEPAQKKKRDHLRYIESEEFQRILNAKSRHGLVLQAAEYQLQERYFDALVKKEQMEEKMKSVREMKCRAVTCKNCNYTFFKPADRCVEENHQLHWLDAVKRFFRCPCGQRAIALDRLPHQHCSNCGLFKWERDGMMKEKKGPKIGGELLQPRGEEHGRFLNSMK
ncbi:protein MCM10 homolog [Cynoglossus semilaevis]|nr:protein MCM10 homolog [Cynoglossus semilaevis]